MLAHLGGLIALEKYSGIYEFNLPFCFGHLGVEIFFVISGFIIYTTHNKDLSRPEEVGLFLKKRAIRIFPVFLIVFWVVYFIAFFTSLRSTLPSDPFVILKTMLLYPQKRTVPVLAVSWTLQYELLFYVSFAFLIINKNIIYIYGMALLYLHLIYFNAEPSFNIEFIQSQHVFLFIIGMIVAYINNLNLKNIKTSFFLCTGLVLFLCAIVKDISEKVLPSASTLEYKILIVGVAVSLIIFGMVQMEKSGFDFKRLKMLNLLGDASYSLYLIHYPILSVLAKFSVVLGIINFGVTGALITYFTLLIACLVAAVMFHMYIEKPILKYFRNRFVVKNTSRLSQANL